MIAATASRGSTSRRSVRRRNRACSTSTRCRQRSDDVACVYVENPGYLGTIETQAAEIASLAHDAGAFFVVGVDPSRSASSSAAPLRRRRRLR